MATRSILRKAIAPLCCALLAAAAACGTGNAGSSSNARAPAGAPAAALVHDAVSVRLMRRMADGTSKEAARIERRLADVRDTPITVLVRQAPSAGKEQAPAPSYELRVEAGAERLAPPAQVLDCNAPATCLSREWLELELRGGSAAPRKIERTLFERPKDDTRAVPSYRRYTVSVLSDSFDRAQVASRIQRELAAANLEGRRKQAETLASGKEEPSVIGQLASLDAGASVGHLTALAFAAQSDALTARLSQSLDVEVRREVPRIIITSAESEGTEPASTFSLDLRLDEIVAVSRGEPQRAKLLQLARGIQESALEGQLLQHFSGKESAVSTARLMNEARRIGTEVIGIGRDNRAELEQLQLPDRVAALVVAALGKGHEVVIPRSPVTLDGRDRWGFWDIDPISGAAVGVMEDGQHQGMVDITTTTRKVALDERKGFLLGLHAGMIQSQFAFAGLMLKYGEVTPQLIQELKDMLKDSACKACPEASVGAEISIKLGEDCIKKDLLKKDAKFGFCERYGEGFKCAVGMLVASLQGEDQLPVKLNTEVKIKLGCGEAKLGGD
ncbi:MAG: hypothetical protein HY898_04825 [Deltaproteobacteria bacterium]|nr:hypothetical protein [Deltaproteobacteria bacterium]